MHILQMIETGGPGGAETIFATLSDALSYQGHKISIIVGPGDWLAPRLRSTGHDVHVVSTRGFLDLTLIRQVRHRLQSGSVDCVHAHLFGSIVYACLAAIGTGVPVIGTLHGQADVNGSGVRFRVKTLLVRYALHTLVTVSKNLQHHALAVLHFPVARSRVVFNGVKIDHHALGQPEGDPSSVVSADGQSDSRVDKSPRIGAVGNIRKSKDYPTLIRAIAIVKQTFPNVHVMIAGAPDHAGLFDECRNLVETLGLTAHVEFLGFTEHPMEFLRRCDVFVLSSSHEGFSLATVEAMLAGTPIVATRSGGPEEIIQDGQTGRLVPIRDPEALASALCKTIQNVEESRTMVANAKVDARERFTVESMVRNYLMLYEALAQR